MTKLLEKAFSEAAKLPEEEQTCLARALLEDLAADEKWDETLVKSQDVLAALADEALTEFQLGKKVHEKLPPQIQRQAKECYQLWKQDPHHRSLQFK